MWFFKEDPDAKLYRGMMSPPETYEDGFTWKTVVGAFFIGALMMPASMYLSLFMGNGGGIGEAGKWVTIIIFAEIARRSLQELKMQEVFILYMMAGWSMSAPFSGMLWNQFFVQSDFARASGVAAEIPAWVAPSAEMIHAGGRTFLTKAWMPSIMLTILGLVTSRFDGFGLGYVLYRIANDVEELPFPFAAVGASGIVALTESKDKREPWRWRCFSIGGMIGLVWGCLTVALPSITGALLAKPILLFPIPFIDYTKQLCKYLPATPMNLVIDLGAFLAGTVMPFWAVIGGLFGVVFTMFANPMLYKHGILHSWTDQMGFIETSFYNNLDFYLPFGMGLTIAISVVSFLPVVETFVRALRANRATNLKNPVGDEFSSSRWRRLLVDDPKRGDFSIFIALAIWVFNTALWIGISAWLIPGFPWQFFVAYAIFYTPIISYATAKLEGLCGQAVSIPYIREATYILSGYKGVAIWFAPAPIGEYGAATVGFRVLELTGTKIKSKVKLAILTLPIVAVGSLLFSELLWRMGPVPSAAYPYAEKMWELQAMNSCVALSATMEGGSQFLEALNGTYFSWGLGAGIVGYVVLSLLGLPTLLVFGMIRGLGETSPGALIFQAFGACVGYFYFRKRFGAQEWVRYAPVMLAGMACGTGLISMVSVGFVILSKMMKPLLY